MARSRARCGQDGPVCTMMLSSIYLHGRCAAGCWNTSGRAPMVLRCLEEMKSVRGEACVSASNISRDVAAKLLTLNSTGGG